MKSRIYRVMTIVILISICLCLCGCQLFIKRTKVVVGGESMDLLFVYDIEDRVGYAREHEKELEFAMFNDVMFYARQSQVASRFDLFVFSHSTEDMETVMIKKVTLVTQDGTVVWDKDIEATLMPISIGELYQEASSEREFDYAVTIVEYDETDSWYYDGSNLALTVEVECRGESTEIVYPVYVHSYWDIPFYF